MQPFQYQLSGITFGRNTNIPISKIDIQPYNVNAGDFQIPLMDENSFGQDSLVPGPIIFTMAVMENYMLEQFANVVPGNFDPDNLFAMRGTVLDSLAQAWKAQQIRQFWGAMLPLLCCTADGKILRIYGRPGKFQYAPRYNDNAAWIDVQAEFRRADALAHANEETGLELAKSANPVQILRTSGDADAYLRILLYGPIEHPVITIGDYQVELDLTIPESTIVELSTYPWQRRIVDTEGVNHRTKMIGASPYLHQIKMPANRFVPIRWTDQAKVTWTELPSTRWEENVDFLDIFTLWDDYEQIDGKAMWGWSPALLDWIVDVPILGEVALKTIVGGFLFAPFGRAAVLDDQHSFTSAGQFAQVRIATVSHILDDLVHQGRTGVVIMSNDDMTNLVCLEIENGFDNLGGQDYIRIMTGSYDNLTMREEYEIPDGFAAFDTVGIWSDPTTSTFHMQHNGEDVGLGWTDSGAIVNQANRRQGFILNIDDSILHHGPGVDDIVAYDIDTEQPTEGRCIVLWRDAYNVI